MVERLGTQLQQRLAAGRRATPAERADYEGVILYLLWLRYENDWYTVIHPPPDVPLPAKVSFYERFAKDVGFFFDPLPGPRPNPAHLFALGYQARRAFDYIFRHIFGASLPIARLRAALWESCFTAYVRAYRDELYATRNNVPTLIIGETGTGNELAAQAIAQSRYVPFDARTKTFAADPAQDFRRVNLAALSPTLIEAEVFGYCKGAFTGADKDHRGRFETCSTHGAVFLDEIGELSNDIQVKLLRVLQSREFSRVGETTTRAFAGKLIAATHRELRRETRAGRFREDLFYRLCGDMVRTPTLREQLADTPEDLPHLVRIAASRVAGPKTLEQVATAAEAWIKANLPPDYAWPGNMRELEQCVHNILTHGHYEADDEADAPIAASGPREESDAWLADGPQGRLTAEELPQGYCARVYAQTGSYEETGRLLDLHWQTVRANVRAWKERRRGSGGKLTFLGGRTEPVAA